MAATKDSDKMDDSENHTNHTSSSSHESSELEKSEYMGKRPQDTGFEPDLDYEEAEAMDNLHQEDLARVHTTTESIRAGPQPDTEGLDRTTTRGSTKSRISRMASKLSSKSKKDRIEEKIPVSDFENGIVGWESQDDPEMPLNFAQNRKWFLLFLLASITFISPLASSMFAPAVEFMDKTFNNTSTILSALTVSIYVLGYVIGPIFLAPLSEIYGRRPVLCVANVFFCVWQIGCALAPNLGSLIVFRLLAGIGGSGCLTIGGGVIADLFRADQRGLASSLYSVGPLFGPVVGPICGGFIGDRAGWRWIFWVLFIAGTCVTVGIETSNRETNHRILIHRKVARLQKELGRPELRSCYDPSGGPVHTKGQILRAGMLRPLKMLFLSPIVFILSLYMSVVYGLLYLLFTTITTVFNEQYDWSLEICGLAYIGLGIGFLSGLALVAKISDSTVVRMTKANNGVFEPEMRLPACIFFACFVPISFFWYGWTAYYKVQWMAPLVGLVPFGFGMMGIFIPIQTYCIDAFPMFAASAVAALTVSRSLFGAFLPLAGPAMYASLGLGWGNSVLGFIAIALIPAPALIYKFGEKIRKEHPIKL